MSDTTEIAATQPRTQRFYCPGCDEYHEAGSLPEAVRREGERIKRESEQSVTRITLREQEANNDINQINSQSIR